MNKPLQIGGWAYAALFTVLISACFSPLGYTGPGNPTAGAGTGALSISFSDAAAAPRKMLDADPSALAYELTFMGPGSQTIVRNASWGQTITVRVTPGVWNVSVMATDPKNTAAGIAAVGEAYNIDVKSGANSDVPVKMGVYSEISGFQELAQLLQDTTTGQDDPYDQFIVLTDSFDMGYSLYITGGESVITNPTGGSEIKSSPKTITIAAVNDVNMNYLNDDSSALFYISGGGKLVFGSASPRFPGNITLNGMYNTGISTSPDGGFVMNNGSLINFSYGVSNEGSFIMNGGTISGGSFGIYNNGDLSINGGDITANDIGIQNYNNIRMSGGSIYGNNDGIENRTQAITDTGITTQRTLSMSGGSISDNSGEGIVFISEKYFNDVYIPMVFYMSGGTITGNNNGINYYSSYSPDNSPDDAATDSDTLIMSGGTVTGNIGNNGNIGYDVYNPGAFTISGAAVAERIYLTGASLNISGALSGNFKSTIFLNPFDTEKQILTGNLSRETRDKFRAADASSSDPSNFASITYPFDSQGKLTLPAETWAQTISLIQGDSGNDTPGAVFNAVALDSAGNMYAAGSQNGNYYYSYGSESTYAGSASTNGVLVKYNSKGQAQWQQLMG
ncbi:MAG: carbohydrate-binding domain-containing protein, partial [Treponema sp.]|nr:carbohydrate-binding domain-containing protein [Treponema sp.]